MTASAKSLFRATKAKRQDNQAPLLAVDESRKPEAPRRADDFYPTERAEDRAEIARAEVVRLRQKLLAASDRANRLEAANRALRRREATAC